VKNRLRQIVKTPLKKAGFLLSFSQKFGTTLLTFPKDFLDLRLPGGLLQAPVYLRSIELPADPGVIRLEPYSRDP
jgi:hypothetical protein